MSLLSQCTSTACHAVAYCAGSSTCKVAGLGNFNATDVYSLRVAGRQTGDLNITPATGHVAAATEMGRGGLLSVSASRTSHHRPRQMMLAPTVGAASCLMLSLQCAGTDCSAPGHETAVRVDQGTAQRSREWLFPALPGGKHPALTAAMQTYKILPALSDGRTMAHD